MAVIATTQFARVGVTILGSRQDRNNLVQNVSTECCIRSSKTLHNILIFGELHAYFGVLRHVSS